MRSGSDLPAETGGSSRARVEAIVAFVAAACYAAVASGTTPFTASADVVVLVPGALFAGMLVLQYVRPGGGPWRRIDPLRPPRGGAASPWVAVILLLIGVELASYFHGGPRADYPTISFGLNVLFHHQAAKAAVWMIWLTGGWHLARR